jgi:hypothetical protein
MKLEKKDETRKQNKNLAKDVPNFNFFVHNFVAGLLGRNWTHVLMYLLLLATSG